MTIRRQYSLPNCTLILDGLSDGSPLSGFADTKPLMSILVNAECHFADRERPISGGGEFFQSLTAAVNQYAQELLSGVAHPKSGKESGIVTITKGDRENLHHLSTLEIGDRDLVPVNSGDRPASIPRTEVDLSTVQLFDLLEAIDRFLADNQTLPSIVAPISPTKAKFNRPLARQVAPAGLGVAGLAAVALAAYTVPSPLKINEPKVITLPPATKKLPTSPQPVAPSNTKPSTTPSQPAATTQPSTAPSQPAATTQPSASPTQPASNTKPSTAPSQPASNTKPSTAPSQPAATTQPSTAPSQPAATTQPSTAPSQPAATTQPSASPSQPASNTKPSTSP